MPIWARYFVVLLPFLGLFLLAIGLWTDVRGILADFPFSINMLSALTGLCFSIPFVIFVIQEINDASDVARRERRVQRATHAALRDFSHAVNAYTAHNRPVYEQMVPIPRELADSLNALHDLYLQDHPGRDYRSGSRSAAAALFQEGGRCAALAVRRHRELGARLHETDEDAWGAVVASWEYLDDVIRQERLDCLLPWLPSHQQRYLIWAINEGDGRKVFRGSLVGLATTAKAILAGAEEITPDYAADQAARFKAIANQRGSPSYFGNNTHVKNRILMEDWPDQTSRIILQFKILEWAASGISSKSLRIQPFDPKGIPVDLPPQHNS
ncbi:hypothetical protein ACAG24_029195 [Mycobacterium sp. pW049]|uniref:hypothetical protein n=1 Tax=[Mycobacterium] bulgaricum TaxID=3238985 RepID=UPI00351B748F